MDKLSHATLRADDTNIIVISTDCNDLHKTVNVTLQVISEWFQINQLVLKNNKIFAINFSCNKTPTPTLNITLDNQNLTESTNFLVTPIDINLLWILHEQIIEETEHSMQFDKEFILFSDSRLIKDSLFCTFSVFAAIWNTFLQLTYKPLEGTYRAKEKNKSDVRIDTKDIVWKEI